MVGIFYYYLADLARRKSFSETRRYIKALITIEGTKSRKVHHIHCTMYVQYVRENVSKPQLPRIRKPLGLDVNQLPLCNIMPLQLCMHHPTMSHASIIPVKLALFPGPSHKKGEGPAHTLYTCALSWDMYSYLHALTLPAESLLHKCILSFLLDRALCFAPSWSLIFVCMYMYMYVKWEAAILQKTWHVRKLCMCIRPSPILWGGPGYKARFVT